MFTMFTMVFSGVPYTAQFGDFVTTVRAYDPDTGIKSQLSYNIVNITSRHNVGKTISCC